MSVINEHNNDKTSDFHSGAKWIKKWRKQITISSSEHLHLLFPDKVSRPLGFDRSGNNRISVTPNYEIVGCWGLAERTLHFIRSSMLGTPRQNILCINIFVWGGSSNTCLYIFSLFTFFMGNGRRHYLRICDQYHKVLAPPRTWDTPYHFFSYFSFPAIFILFSSISFPFQLQGLPGLA